MADPEFSGIESRLTIVVRECSGAGRRRIVTLEVERLNRLRRTMESLDVTAVLTADPANVVYATGVRNMTVFSMMGAFRFVLVLAEGPVVLWEFAGCEHLAASAPSITEVRIAPDLTPASGSRWAESTEGFAREVADLVKVQPFGGRRLAIERFDHHVTDALRAQGCELTSATEVFASARRIKTAGELAVMGSAMDIVTAALETMRERIEPGRTEVEVWAELHRGLIAQNGEFISTRLAQAGSRTFPYFNEAGTATISSGDLFCVDTDAIGPGGYGADFSRTFVCGDRHPSPVQQSIFSMALEQLRHNASLLAPGRSYESFARSAWAVPARFAPYRYYCLAHGLGLTGEPPYIPVYDASRPFPVSGAFEPGMVICIESYIGDPESHQGVKLEDQYLITEQGTELMSTMPHELTGSSAHQRLS